MPSPVVGVIAGSSLLGARSARKAAKAQERAANKQMDLARETRDQSREDLKPYSESGKNALLAYRSELGLGDAPEGYQKAPGYDARLQEGRDTLEASAAMRGGLNSGSTLKALTRYGQDYATRAYDGHLNRLRDLSMSGQNAAAAQAGVNQGYSAQASNALANMGDAQAAGYTGVANALSGGVNNMLSLYAYKDELDKQYGYQNALLNPKGWWK